MQFIVVAEEGNAPLGRQLAHALSMHDGHSGTYWSMRHYEDNEASLANQPVIFLGESKIAASYAEVLPLRFESYDTSCWFEGSKAVLTVDTPDYVSADAFSRFRRVVEGRSEELRHLAESSTLVEATVDAPGQEVVRVPGSTTAVDDVPLGARLSLAMRPAFNVGRGLVESVVQLLKSGSRKTAYTRLQYRYVLDRFLAEEFDGFVAGVDGR